MSATSPPNCSQIMRFADLWLVAFQVRMEIQPKGIAIREGEPYHPPDPVDVHSLPQLHPLTGEMLRRAYASFPGGTSVGHDAIAPKACARLSNHTLDALVSILNREERELSWSNGNMLVFIRLLPEPDGPGLCPIGIFPNITRVWMRARLPLAQE